VHQEIFHKVDLLETLSKTGFILHPISLFISIDYHAWLFLTEMTKLET